MPDLQRVLPDYDPLDQQLQDPLPLGQRRLVEPRPQPMTERLEVRPHRLRGLPLGTQALLLIALGGQDLPAAPDPVAAGPQLV